jgi:hypothetical protein
LLDAAPRCVIDAIAWPRHVEASLIDEPFG